jgi:zinc/manganese transport system permease protein
MSEGLNFFLKELTLIAVVLVLHTYIGLHIIRRVLIFSDLALDQLAAFGALVALAAWGVAMFSAWSYVAALVAVLAGAFFLAVVKPKSNNIPREAVIGIIYALVLIASIILTDCTDWLPKGNELLQETLTGKLDWVSWTLVGVTVVVYAALLVFHYIFRRKFISLVDEPEKVNNPQLWDFLFFASQGVITVLIVPVAGVFLAYVFLMIPAAIAAMFTHKWLTGLVFGWSVGFVACGLGLTGSYLNDWPFGPSLVLSMGVFFIAAVIIRSLLPDKRMIDRTK